MIAGDNGVIIKTVNGGANWELSDTGITGEACSRRAMVESARSSAPHVQSTELCSVSAALCSTLVWYPHLSAAGRVRGRRARDAADKPKRRRYLDS